MYTKGMSVYVRRANEGDGGGRGDGGGSSK